MVQKALMYKANGLKLFFPQLTLLFKNLVLSSYLSSILLRIMVSLVMRRSPENIKKRRKQTEEKN